MMLTRQAADSGNVPILSNHWASRIAFVNEKNEMDKIERLTKGTYSANPREYILWDSQFANSPFSQKELMLEDVRGDPSVRLVESVHMDYGSIFLFLRDSRMHITQGQE